MTFLLSFLGFGKMIFGAVAQWLSRRSLAEIVCIALGLALALDHMALLMSHRHARKADGQLIKCSNLRKADRKSFEDGQAAAIVRNLVQVGAIQAQQKRISDAQVQTLNGRIARLSDELRAHGPAAQSHPDAAGLPQVPRAAGGADAASGLCLSPDQLLRAAQDEERHNELIDWLSQQMTVDPSKL